MFFIILGNAVAAACGRLPHVTRAALEIPAAAQRSTRYRAAARCGARHRGGAILRGDRWQERSAVDGWTAVYDQDGRLRAVPRTCRGTGEPLLRARRCQKLKHTDDCPKGWSLTPLRRCVRNAASIRETLSRPDAIHTQVGRNAHRLLWLPRALPSRCYQGRHADACAGQRSHGQRE